MLPIPTQASDGDATILLRMELYLATFLSQAQSSIPLRHTLFHKTGHIAD